MIRHKKISEYVKRLDGELVSMYSNRKKLL
jgi:hypothetical protein